MGFQDFSGLITGRSRKAISYKSGIDTVNGREYIAGVVTRGISASGAGIRDLPEKANFYPYNDIQIERSVS
jgi:hypothetical protein